MASDDEIASPRRPSARDAAKALQAMAHDTRNGLTTIVARAQLIGRRLRGGAPIERERIARDAAEIERVAKRTAARIDEIDEGVRAPRGSGPLGDGRDHGGGGP